MNKLINYTQTTTKEDWGQLLPLVSFCSYITAALLSLPPALHQLGGVTRAPLPCGEVFQAC